MTAVEYILNLVVGEDEQGKDVRVKDTISKSEIAKAKEMEIEQKIDIGKRCFYKGFEKAESDDANCFTAWREEAEELLTFKSE